MTTPDLRSAVEELMETLDEDDGPWWWQTEAEKVRAALAQPEPLDAAYRERNAVVAALIRSNGWPRWVAMAPDAGGWIIVYAETPEGQVSWHVGPGDFGLFEDFPGVAPGRWDGHTTEEKYRRLAALTTGQHEPGESHRYTGLVCQVCGVRGMVTVSIEPQRAPEHPDCQPRHSWADPDKNETVCTKCGAIRKDWMRSPDERRIP